MAEKDRFRLLQEAFYARGDLIVDIFQARGVSGASAGDRCARLSLQFCSNVSKRGGPRFFHSRGTSLQVGCIIFVGIDTDSLFSRRL